MPLLSSAQEVFTRERVVQISLEFYSDNWEKNLKSFKQNNIEKRLPARMKVDNIVFDSVAVRFKGNSSYNNPKKRENRKLPFNIDLNEYDEDAALSDGTKKIKLSNSFRDPSFVREILTYEIVQRYLPAPQFGFFRLDINGEDYGLYIGTSSIDKHFLKRSFGTKKGKLFKCDPDYDLADIEGCDQERLANLIQFDNEECYKTRYELKSKKGWKELNKLINDLNKVNNEPGKFLDVHDFLWMHAINMVLVNLDSYTGRLSHNYYLYKDSNKLWQPIMWDFNLSFGGFPFDGSQSGKLTTEQLSNLPIFLHYENAERPLISKLLQKSIYRKLYLGMIKTICEDYFLNDKYKSLIRTYQSVIRSTVLSKGKKLYNDSQFEKSITETVKLGKVDIIGIQELMDKRLTYLKETRVFAPDQPTMLDQSITIDSISWTLECRLLKTEKASLYYRLVEGGPWQKKQLENELLNWKVTLPISDRPVAYFVEQENTGNASLQPSNAPHQFFQPE